MKARIAVGVSGGGRSLANFLARQGEPGLRYEVAAVVASRPDCRGAQIARDHGLPLFVGDFAAARRDATEGALTAWLATHAVDWVALAGFLKIYPVSPAWRGRVVNIHPALLPAFGGPGMYGDRVHAAVVAAGRTVSGATLHFVTDRYDEGAVIEQVQVPVEPGDDAHALADRVFAAECRFYPEALSRLIAVTAYRERFDAFLAEKAAGYAGAIGVDPVLRYVLGTGGKRVRPLLAMLSAEALGADPARALPAGAAVEMVHTYSLVHDDLPCMDDDDLRRGEPTAHRQFDEASALLAGDALLTDAFKVLADDPDASAEARIAMVRELAGAAGGAGMVRGQSLDLHWTARPGAGRADLDEIHRNKTGLLLGAAAALGACAAGRIDLIPHFRAFGQHLGLAFQIRDDLIDELGATGKTAGKDKEAGKLTYLALMSAEEAMRAADEHTAAAERALAAAGAATPALIAFARALLYRTN